MRKESMGRHRARSSVPLNRFADLVCFGHPQARRMERSTLIVVEDATHRRAVVEHHGTCQIVLWQGWVRWPYYVRRPGSRDQ